MIGALVVAASASFALTCDMIEVDPMVGWEGPEQRQISLVSRKGKVVVSGWDERMKSFNLRLYRRDGGWWIEGDFADSLFAAKTMASLRPSGGGYALEWGVGEQSGKQGQWKLSIMTRGMCRPGGLVPASRGTHQ